MTSSVWLVRLPVFGKISPLRSRALDWQSSFQVWSHSDEHRVLSIRAVSELESMVYSLECNRQAQQCHNVVIVARWWQ